MLTVETIGRIRREHFLKGKTIKEIARDLKVSRNTVRKVLRSGKTAFEYDIDLMPCLDAASSLNLNVLAETRSDRQRLGERSVLVSDVVRLRSSSPSSSAWHQGRSASAFYQSTIGLDVAFAHCTLGSKHRDRLAARRWNGTPFYETRYGKIR